MPDVAISSSSELSEKRCKNSESRNKMWSSWAESDALGRFPSISMVMQQKLFMDEPSPSRSESNSRIPNSKFSASVETVTGMESDSDIFSMPAVAIIPSPTWYWIMKTMPSLQDKLLQRPPKGPKQERLLREIPLPHLTRWNLQKQQVANFPEEPPIQIWQNSKRLLKKLLCMKDLPM